MTGTKKNSLELLHILGAVIVFCLALFGLIEAHGAYTAAQTVLKDPPKILGPQGVATVSFFRSLGYVMYVLLWPVALAALIWLGGSIRSCFRMR